MTEAELIARAHRPAPDLGGGVTYAQIDEAALSRVMELTDAVPSSSHSRYRTIGFRQQALYSMANATNADYFGRSLVAPLALGAVDLTALVDHPLQVERVTQVRIAGPGTSKLDPGTRVSVVPSDDPDSGLPPRVTLRGYLMAQVEADLEGVRSLWVDYAYRPAPAARTENGTTPIELPVPFQKLLVVDLTKELVTKALRLDSEVKAAQLRALEAEEQALLADFLAAVRGFAPLDARFHAPEG